MKYKDLAEEIISMKNQDLKLRSDLLEQKDLGPGYNPKMEAMHIKHAEALDRIIDLIGYPTINKVGKEGSNAAWLIIQHAISLPSFMRKCCKLLEIAVEDGEADRIDFAYLIDRIAVFEGKLQLYGTQYDWDETGQISPHPYDDINKVNKRRKALGLNSVQEQTTIMRNRAKIEKEKPPADITGRKLEMKRWKKSVGWIA